MKLFKNNLDKYQEDLNKIKEKYIELENNISKKFNNYKILYNIIQNLMYNLDNEENTYENLYSIINLNFKKFNKELFNFFENIKIKYNNLLDKEKKKKEIIFLYQNDNHKNTKIKIFGKIFILNNKNKCKIFINEKEIELAEYYDIDPKF